MSLTFGNFMNQIFEALGIENKEKIMKVLSSLDNKSKNKIIKDVKLKNTMKKLLNVDKNINKLNTNFLNTDTVKIFNSFKENLGFLQSLYIYKNIEVNTFIQNLLNLINLKITLMGSMNSSNNNKDFKIVDLNKKELLALNNSEDTVEENNILALEDTPENTTTELPQTISGPPMQIINDIDDKADKVAKDKADKVAKDKADKVAKDKTDKVAKDKTDKVVKDKTDKVVKDKTDKVAKDKADKVAKDKADRVAKDKADRVAKDKADRVAKDKADKDAKRVIESNKLKKNKLYEDKIIMNKTKKILEDYKMIKYNNNSNQTFLNNRILDILNNMIKLLKDKLLNGYDNLGINHKRYEVQIESEKNVEKMLKLLESIKNGGVYPDYNKIKNLEQVIENVVPELRWYTEIRSSNVNNSVRFYRWHMEIKSILKRIDNQSNLVKRIDNQSNLAENSKEEDSDDENNNKYNYYEKYLKYKSKYLKLKK